VCELFTFVELRGRMSMTSRVIAMAKTPSLKASSRFLVTGLSLIPLVGASDSDSWALLDFDCELPGLLDHPLIIQGIQ
jgi:hypothetical protein